MLPVWRWLLPLVAGLAITNGLPVPDETIDTSTKLIGSSVVTSVSVVIGQEDGTSEKSDTRKVTEDLPASTVDMLKPDGFRFYTVDERGQLITRQMTDAEIQSIIAAGGGPFPMETQDSQKTGEDTSGDTKVADVVQNVQNVLKAELSKPPMAIGNVPTIPGHANDEWSSILPSILGGETESAPVTLPEAEGKPVKEIIKDNFIPVEMPAAGSIGPEKSPAVDSPVGKPEGTESLGMEMAKPNEEKTGTDETVKIDEIQKVEEAEKPAKETQENSERPMIQVPVITAGSVQSTTKDPSLDEEKPVYQILNTISVEEVKDKDVEGSQGSVKPADQKPEATGTETESSDSSLEAVSATEKIENKVKEPEVAEEVTSGFVPLVQKGSDKTETSSGGVEVEEVKPEKPSIVLEAPAVGEKPVDPAAASGEKEPQVITEGKPAVEEDVDETATAPSRQTETTSSGATVGQKVPENVNFIPESINSIVDELISETTVDTEVKVDRDEVKLEDPAASGGDDGQKKPEASTTDDGSSSASKESENSDDKVTPAPQIPETEIEPVFQMLPEIGPGPSDTKAAPEAPMPSENVGSKPEMDEAAPEPTKITPEATPAVDKIEEPTGTESQSEATQNSTPVIEALTTEADSATDKNDQSNTEATQMIVEKKPETLLSELADSVSSVISQVSEVMPSMVPIPQKSDVNEQPVKRVEDGINNEEASTVRSEVLPSMVTIASEEEAEPLVSDVEMPMKEEATKPEKIEPEAAMVEVKIPDITTASSTLDDSETTKITEPVSNDLVESSGTTNEKLDSERIEVTSESSSDVEKAESAISEEKKTEVTMISESSSDRGPVKSEEPVASKPEDSEPEKSEVVAKDETKTETVAEAPIVRIDISEAKPTVSDLKDDHSTESSVVRIQLANTVSTINQIIDSAPEIITPVDVQAITLPEENVLQSSPPQTIGSDLIAGTQASTATEIKTPEDSPASSTADSAGNQKLEVPSPTESAAIESEMKPTLKPAAETSSDVKPMPEIEDPKIPEPEPTRTTTQAKPEAIDEVNNESTTSETQVKKSSEKSDETKLEKPVETQNFKDSAATAVKVAPLEEVPVKIDPQVPGVEKIESSTKNEDREKPGQTPGNVVESVTVVSEEKNEETNVPKPVEEPAEVSTVKDTSAVVPQEVVVSTTVDVQPTKELAEKIKEDDVKPVKSGEKTEYTNTKNASEKIPEKKPEGDNTATKIQNASNESTQDLQPVESTAPAPTRPEVQPSDQVSDVSTSAPASGDEDNDKTEAPLKMESPTTAQTDSEIQITESTEKKSESLPEKESEDASQGVEEPSASAGKPEVVQTDDPKSQASGNEPEKKIPSTKEPGKDGAEEASVPEAVGEDQPSVPLVRIDASPEKTDSESSTTKIEKIPESPEAGNKITEKPESPASTEINSSVADESQKKTDNPEDDSAVETSSAQSAASETSESTLESLSQAPTKAGDTEETKVEMPDVKKPEVVVKTSEESVKETVVNSVDSKVPEVTGSLETTSSAGPSPAKVESVEAAKPVRVDTTLHNATHNAPPKTQEIRIQVNDTAVLVTKQQIPQKSGNDEKKDKPNDISDPNIEKIEVSDQSPQKIEVPSQPPQKVEVLSQPTKVQKPAPVANIPQANKITSKPTADKVKAESDSQTKKPAGDPYVKLGEKKPVDQNDVKTPIPVVKKPVNTVTNKEGEEKWTLITQGETFPAIKQEGKPSAEETLPPTKNEDVSVPLEAHQSAVSLDESTRHQDEDVSNFAKLCNELAFSFWVATNKGLSTARSLALSPFGMTSMLAMVFLGARGPTSGQMNDILGLDDVVTFNPHLVFQNVSDGVNLARGQGIANAAFVRELFADRLKAGRLLPFYKERAQQFYDGHVEEVNFATISDLVRRRTNLLIRRQTGGRIRDFVKGNVMPLRSPLAALSANVFQTDCTGASSEGRDGEMYFAVLPAVRQRKLVPVPATVWRSGVLAGYEPGLDATVISLGGVGNLVSTIFVLPGQQGLAAPGDSLDHLEKRLLEGAFADGVWDRLIRVLIPRMGLEVQVPKFSHRSVVNATAALKRMGLDELFSKHADLKGINGVGNDLHLADMLQINLFSTCGDEAITGGRHHVEIYPASPLRGARIDKTTLDEEEGQEEAEFTDDKNEENRRRRRGLNLGEYVQRFHDLDKRSTAVAAEEQLIPEDHEDEERSQRSSNPSKELMQLTKGKQSERPLLKLDRPFLYFVRHNPTGMILHMGRFNPRLMP